MSEIAALVDELTYIILNTEDDIDDVKARFYDLNSELDPEILDWVWDHTMTNLPELS